MSLHRKLIRLWGGFGFALVGCALLGMSAPCDQILSNLSVLAAEEVEPPSLNLFARKRIKTSEEGEYQVVYEVLNWPARKTAAIVCDMWDNHHCPSAARRVNEMAPRMNNLLKALRKQGVLIIHCPSGTMKYYEGTSGRLLALQAPKVETAVPLQGWCKLDPTCEGPLPIDDSDGGCEDPGSKPAAVWTRQNDLIEIESGDAIGDNVEVIYLLKQRQIENVIIMGVHVNMCVLGRPFGIRQLVRQGFNVVLVRDMTDSMYNPARPPYVSHVRGTELVVEHIEKFWCPTITSGDILGGPAFRFAEDRRPHVAFLVSDDHYQADKLLPQFAQWLTEKYDCYTSVMHGLGKQYIHGIDELEAADCLVLYIRRLALPDFQLEKVKRYLSSGKPLVALRTASHAFALRGNTQPPAGHAQWPEFDHEVLGGNYRNHTAKPGTEIEVLPEAQAHPIVAGLPVKTWVSEGTLYLVSPLREDAQVLMLGRQGTISEPVTWVRQYQGGRIFYTSLGHPSDFQQPMFRQLLVNAIFWSINRPIPEPR